MPSHALIADEIERFIHDGFVRLDGAFSPSLAAAARAILWRDLPCDPNDPLTWTQPVIRLGWYDQAPFRDAANTPRLHAAYDQLLGKGRWRPRTNLGSFPVRFPHPDSPGDDGWHVDLSFPGPTSDPAERQDFSSWRINIRSRGRGLLLLFLFSDIGEDDAPTRVRSGSHRDVARVVAPFGEDGVAGLDCSRIGDQRDEVSATGEAGTVYLCHPFLVHAAQRHRGTTPRFLAQPPLGEPDPFGTKRPGAPYSPVEIAIRSALDMVC